MLPIPNHNYVRKATNKHFKHFFIFEAVSAEFINTSAHTLARSLHDMFALSWHFMLRKCQFFEIFEFKFIYKFCTIRMT